MEKVFKEWSFKPDSDLVWETDDDIAFTGNTQPLTAEHYVLRFGKYEGMNLNEINDEWYLNFLQKMAVDKSDWLLGECVKMRLNELH